MLGLPKSTEMSKQLPKKAVYAKFQMNTAAKEKIDADISRITIVNEITPAKINIPAGEEVGSFFVLLEALKKKDFDERTVATLSKLIPQNILFVLELEGQSKLAIYHTNHKYAYTVDFDSAELIRNAIAHIDKKLFVSELQYTTTIGRQKVEMNEYEIERGDSFTGEKTRTQTLKHAEASQIKYDLIGKIAEGTVLTRRTVSAILQGIRVDKLYMFRNNPEEFISKVIRLINEQKATMIVEHIFYDTIEGEYDSSIFTAEKATQSFDKAFLAKKAIQDYVFTDGSADKSIERKFAEDLDAAEEVCVYAKLPRTFQIPTPVGNYSPDWAIAFYEGTVKHIFFIAETKGTMESLELRPIEQAKISCAKKLFNEMSTSNVVYHDVDSYQSLLSIMSSI